MKPITIRLAPWMCEELSACEEGSYVDNQQMEISGHDPDRNLEAHAHIVAKREASKGRITIRSREEALDLYYAVCSGVFKAKTPATYRAACRIANRLRKIAREVDPWLVEYWTHPAKEEFTGL